jgi:hypothetical protein
MGFSISNLTATVMNELSRFLEMQRQLVANDFSNWPIDLLISSLCIGFITMTIVEMNKVTWRKRFHETAVNSWIIDPAKLRFPMFQTLDMVIALCLDMFDRIRSNRTPQHQDEIDNNKKYDKEFNKTALDQLVMFSTAGNKNSFFSLPIEGLCGQIAAGSQMILESPKDNMEAIRILVGRHLNDNKTSYDMNVLFRRSNTNSERASNESPSDQSFIESRARISAHIQRNIDSLQINTSFKWKKRMRFYSMLTGLAVGSLGLIFSTDKSFYVMALFIALTAYIGAFVASIFSDLLAVLEKNKK